MTTWGPSEPTDADADAAPAPELDGVADETPAADADVAPAVDAGADLPTMADLDALSIELDGVDATLAALDVRAAASIEPDHASEREAEPQPVPVGAEAGNVSEPDGESVDGGASGGVTDASADLR